MEFVFNSSAMWSEYKNDNRSIVNCDLQTLSLFGVTSFGMGQYDTVLTIKTQENLNAFFKLLCGYEYNISIPRKWALVEEFSDKSDQMKQFIGRDCIVIMTNEESLYVHIKMRLAR